MLSGRPAPSIGREISSAPFYNSIKSQAIFKMTKGYLFAEVTLHTPGAEWEEYSAKVKATLDAYGGVFLVRGGSQKVMEGDVGTGTIVILEFESVKKAEEWNASPAYQEIVPLRLGSANTRIVCLSGTH
jgi:uncharacterized protein (DUF1330 family)